MTAQRRILIVDDEPHILEVLKLFSETLGYAGDAVLSGDEAINMITHERYWAIFCDLQMPGINGIDIFEKVLRIDNNLSKRFVMITGNIFDGEGISTILSKKRIVLLRKPFLFDEIKKTFELLEQV